MFSEYEQQRNKNIKRNNAYLRELGIDCIQPVKKIKSDQQRLHGIGHPRSRYTPPKPGNAKQLRRSPRFNQDDFPVSQEPDVGGKIAAHSKTTDSRTRAASEQRNSRRVRPAPAVTKRVPRKMNMEDSIWRRGADVGAVLVGSGKLNSGLLIRVHDKQPVGGAGISNFRGQTGMLDNIIGSFDVISGGSATGKYAAYSQFLDNFIQCGPQTVDSILSHPNKPASLTYTFVCCAFHHYDEELDSDCEVDACS